MAEIIVNKTSIEKFLTNYNIGKLVSFKHVKKGFANLVYYLKTTKGEYILKIELRNNPNDRFKYEIELLEFLKGLPVPKIIRTKDRKLFIRYQGVNGAFIYNYLSGQNINKFSKNQLEQVGTLLGKVHLKTTKFRSPVKRMKLYTISPNSFKLMASLNKETKDKKILAAFDYIKKELPKYILPASLPQGSMHMDFKPGNTLFERGKLSGLIDFDNAYRGPLIFDLAHTIMWFCPKRKKFDKDGVRAVYKAYNKIRPLSKLEKKYFWKALNYSCLSLCFVDIYYFIYKKKLNSQYLNWVLDNILPAQKHLALHKYDFDLFK